MKYIVFMCHTIKILTSNWPRTRKYSHLLQAGKTVAFDFANPGHALVTLYFQFLCSDWSNFDRRVHAENLCRILNLVYFDSWSWQSLVSTCDELSFSTGCTKWNSAARSQLRSLLLFSWFLVKKYINCQSGKSDLDGLVFVFHLAWCVRVEKSEGNKSNKQKWELGGRICDFGNFFTGFIGKSPRVLRILNECNLYCKIVKYCIMSEVCMIKTVPHSTVSPQMWRINGIKGYTHPDLLARFCKVLKLVERKKFGLIFFQA